MNKFQKIQKIIRSGKAKSFYKVGDFIKIPFRDENLESEFQTNLIVTGFNQFITAPKEFRKKRGRIWTDKKSIVYTESEFPKKDDLVFLDGLLSIETGKVVKSYKDKISEKISVQFFNNLDLEFENVVNIMKFDDCQMRFTTTRDKKFRKNKNYYRDRGVNLLKEGKDYKIGEKISKTIYEKNLGYKCPGFYQYGHNRYKNSLIRQYLNSSGMHWWKTKEIFQILPPANLETPGFLTRIPSEFLNILGKRKYKIHNINHVTNKTQNDELIDLFWIPSVYENQICKELNSKEYQNKENDPILEFYKNNSDICKNYLKLDESTYFWTRTPILNYGDGVWVINDEGTLSTDYAFFDNGIVPSCCIV